MIHTPTRRDVLRYGCSALTTALAARAQSIPFPGPGGVGSSFTPFDVGFNFRATSGYVTDLSPDTYSLGAAYPETRGGATFGFSDNAQMALMMGVDLTSQSRNRDNGVNAHFAGILFDGANQVNFFVVDIVPGTYSIRLAAGDFNNIQTEKVVVKDSTTTKATITGTTTLTPGYLDATGTEYSAVNWPANNTAISFAFTTTQIRFYIGDGTNNTTLSYIRITRTA